MGLTIVMIFFCMVPVYKALEKRWSHWDDLENDPRWNADSFQFSPTSPQMARAGGLSNNKYNRLSTCGSVGGNSGSSRSGSFRNKCALPRAEDQVEIKMPPAYADIFAGSGTAEAGKDTGSTYKLYGGSAESGVGLVCTYPHCILILILMLTNLIYNNKKSL